VDAAVAAMSEKRRVAGGGVEWRCRVCRYATPSQTNLVNHVERNHLDTCFPCPACAKAFRSRHALHTHRRRIHEAEEKLLFVCPDCDAAFGKKRALRAHCQTEHKDA
jgi:hypothetical protein